tara:strand:- start:328 stop:471 length:144 start_codon:yes stop_codon:yes gene_type:complete
MNLEINISLITKIIRVINVINITNISIKRQSDPRHIDVSIIDKFKNV